jgi:hypothetical protein
MDLVVIHVAERYQIVDILVATVLMEHYVVNFQELTLFGGMSKINGPIALSAFKIVTPQNLVEHPVVNFPIVLGQLLLRLQDVLPRRQIGTAREFRGNSPSVFSSKFANASAVLIRGDIPHLFLCNRPTQIGLQERQPLVLRAHRIALDLVGGLPLLCFLSIGLGRFEDIFGGSKIISTEPSRNFISPLYAKLSDPSPRISRCRYNREFVAADDFPDEKLQIRDKAIQRSLLVGCMDKPQLCQLAKALE